jgi:hypothetical protein
VRVPKELLRDTITVEDYEGAGARGAIYGEPRQVRAQVQPTARVWVERDNTGVSQDIDALAVIRPEDGPISVESRVIWGGTRWRVVRSYAMPDERRPYHHELALTRYSTVRSGGSGSGGSAS